MAKAKRRGYGTTAELDIAGNGTFVLVGYSKNLTPPNIEIQEVDGTTLDDDYEQIDPGLQSASESSIKQFTDPNDSSDLTGPQLDELAENKTKRDLRYTYPGGAVETGEVWIKSIVKDEVQNNEFQTRTVTFKHTEKMARS